METKINISAEEKIQNLVYLQKKFTENFQFQINRTETAADNLILAIHQITRETENQIDLINKVVNETNFFSSELDNFFTKSKESHIFHQKMMKVALSGKQSTSKSIDAIKNIDEAVLSVHSVLRDLAERIKEINIIANSIQNIAQNSKILAINASIEAARAGEAGRGFGVVALEMEKMASKTSDAVENISNVIENIQTGITNTVQALDLSQNEVQEGKQVVNATTQVFTDIIQSIEATVQNNEKLLNSLSEKNQKFQIVLQVAQNLEKVSQAIRFLTEMSTMESANSQTSFKILAISANQLQIITKEFQKVVTPLQNQTLNTLYTAIQTPINSMDPHLAFDVETNRILLNIHAGLVTRSITNEILPGLAKTWNLKNNLKTWVFNLRRGAHFHNGREIVAQDVVFSFTRLLSPKLNSQNAWFLFPIKDAQAFNEGKIHNLNSIRSINRYQIEIDLEIPDLGFLHNLAQATCAILPSEEVKKNNFIGGGPYRFEKYENHVYYLAAFPDYFGGSAYLDYIEIIDNHQEALPKFIKGKLDFFLLENNEIDAIQTNEFKIPIQKSNLLMNHFGAFNFQHQSVFSNNIDLRKAINYAVNKQRIIKMVWGGFGDISTGIYPEGILADPSEIGYPYNPTQAKRLIQNSGINVKNHPLKILKAKDPLDSISQRNQMLNFIIEDLKFVGIPVQIIEVPRNQYFTQQAAAKVDLFLMAWLADTPDADNYIRPLFTKGNFSNFGHFEDLEFEAKMNRAKPILNAQKRYSAYKEIQKHLLQQVPWLLLLTPKQTYIQQEYLSNFHLSALGTIHYEDIMKIQKK